MAAIPKSCPKDDVNEDKDLQKSVDDDATEQAAEVDLAVMDSSKDEKGITQTNTDGANLEEANVFEDNPKVLPTNDAVFSLKETDSCDDSNAF